MIVFCLGVPLVWAFLKYNLIRRWLDTDIEQTKLRQRYVAIFRRVLPGKKAATFFQLDRRISTMIDVQLTSQLPLAQSQD
jgi:hypothetical protein